MTIIDFMNERSRRLSIFGWKLAQGASMCIALIVARLNPELLDVDIWWFVGLAGILYIKPLYVFYLRQEPS